MVALNLFLQDVYGKQRIFADRQILRSLVCFCRHFKREVIGIEVPRGIHTHICGIGYGRDYADIAPVRGVYKGDAGHRLSVDVRVRPEVNDGGGEQLSENKIPKPEPAVVLTRVQQSAQQQ